MNVLTKIHISNHIPLLERFNISDSPFKPPPPHNIHLSSTLALEVVFNLRAFGWSLFIASLRTRIRPDPFQFAGSVSRA
jgi:hypothetical protein